ncbi:hypothetical protein [Saccharothrix sp. NRRL B-16348]|uniref:hypothetical protein n=1 Tax=Saccharothrix sp. NRRL B-16348 TaxID=1415542 RepID=UPI0012F90F89|nr:hypothetical protein [Saccharothrix sp. NRRL B-16348]
MTARRVALVLVPVVPVVAVMVAAGLWIAEVGRLEGPGDAASLRAELSVEGFDRVAMLPDADVFAGPAGTAVTTVTVSGPGAPWREGGTTVDLPEELQRGLDVVVSGRAGSDCLAQVARVRRDALPREALRSVPQSEVDGAAAGDRDLLYAWVTCGGG